MATTQRSTATGWAEGFVCPDCGYDQVRLRPEALDAAAPYVLPMMRRGMPLTLVLAEVAANLDAIEALAAGCCPRCRAASPQVH